MAFYNDAQEEEKNQDPNAQPAAAQAPSGGGLITGGGSAPAANGAAPAPAKAATPDRPGNFVGIQKYLDANKPQAAKLGDQAAGVINQSANQARQGVASLNQEAGEKIKAVNSLAPEVTQKLQTGAESLSDQERKLVKDTENASYKGPADETGLSGYQAASNATKKAVSNIDNSGTEQGRMNLVGQINSAPRTQGMNVFDNALLQAGGGREKLAQAATANQDVKGGLDAASQAIRGQIGRADDPSTPDIDESAGAIGTTNKSKAEAYKSVQDALNSWKTGFDPKVKSAQDALVNQQNSLTSDLGDNQYGLDQSTLDAFGLKGGERGFGLDLKNYLTNVSPGDINAANIASAQDYARYAALQDLSGDQSNVLDQKNIGLAGTAPTNVVDQAKFLADRKAKEDAFNQLMSGTRLSSTGNAGGYNGRSFSVGANQDVKDYLANPSQNIGYSTPSQYDINGGSMATGGMTSGQIMNMISQNRDAVSSAQGQASSGLANQIKQWLDQQNYNTQINRNG